MSDTNKVNDSMLEVFLFEMSSMLEELDDILLTSEKQRHLTEDDVNEIFRIMHTIKGSSAMMDFHIISSVTHKLEDTFYYIRENGIDNEHFTPLFDLILDASDFLKLQLETIQNGDDLAESNDELIERVATFLQSLTGKAPAEAAPAPVAPVVAEPQPELSPTGHLFQLSIRFEEDCGMENLRAFMLLNTLNETCRIISYDPSDIERNPASAAQIIQNGFTVLTETALSEVELRGIALRALHVKTADVTPMTQSGIDSSISARAALGNGTPYRATVFFEEDSGMENLRAFMLLNSLKSSCNILGYIPLDIESNPETAASIMQNGFIIDLESTMDKDILKSTIQKMLHVKKVQLATLAEEGKAAKPAKEPKAEPAAAAPSGAAPAVASPQAGASHPGKPVKQDLINVSLSKLDALMDIMGELVITESMVTRSPDLKGLPLENFNKSARQLRKLTDELQDMVMSIRMIPVSATFQKMQRVVRDMCRNLNKDVDLITMGEETDIDKTIIDSVSDPIMHLVRNAMDHGIETPQDRMASNKSSKGTITLSAQNTGGEILITVSDDGKGLDPQKLLSKAKSLGMLTKPEKDYTDREVFNMLTLPGFSTKDSVTEYSGRGVGMDVVRKNVEKVGGSLVIESTLGMGTTVFLKIPLTLAIVDGMDIAVGGGNYTLQITSINESFKVSADQVLHDTMGNEMIMIRGNVYPIIRLHELFDVPDAITNIDDGLLIWVSAEENSVCLFVDKLIGEQQIVVKPLPVYLNKFETKSCGIAGCTILGDGNISLILDVGTIINKVMEKR